MQLLASAKRIPVVMVWAGSCLMFTGSAAGLDQWRGIWVDAFHAGFKSATEVDALIARAVQGRYNAIVAEVLAYHDRGDDGHGAYWHSNVVPRAKDVSSSFDPLAYLCQQAAAHNIQVHAWLVTFRVCSEGKWPPGSNLFLASHPEYFMVHRENIGTLSAVGTPGKSGTSYVLDPGSPDVQEYLVSIVRELVSNYPIHGINWDYIRYTQTNAGYPADLNYQNSGLKRFHRIYGRSDVPSTSDTQWSDFRRRTIDELIRRCRAEIANIRTNPNQPVMQTVDAFISGSAPTYFTSSTAWTYHQNWKLWAESGWVDAVTPMNYKRDHCSNQYNDYRNWVNRIMQWKGPRHAYIGQATYLNSFSDSVAQMQYTFSRNAEGAVNYSYVGTRAVETICDEHDDWTSDWSWYSHVASNVYTTPATVPPLPWRNPATAGEGTIWGRVFDFATGLPIDDAAVTVSGRPTIKTDANGYYTVTLVPCTAAGTNYAMTISRPGTSMQYPAAKILAGDLVRYDFALGAPPPQIVLDTTSLTRVLHSGQSLPDDILQVSAGSGGGFLNYSVSSNVGWLSVSPSSGISYGQQTPVTISYPISRLGPGTYTGTVTVADPAAANNPATLTVTLKLPKPCDFDLDDDVDQDDFAYLQSCLTGPGVAISDPACSNANLDGDSDADQNDVARFLGCWSGPNVPSYAFCLPD